MIDNKPIARVVMISAVSFILFNLLRWPVETVTGVMIGAGLLYVGVIRPLGIPHAIRQRREARRSLQDCAQEAESTVQQRTAVLEQTLRIGLPEPEWYDGVDDNGEPVYRYLDGSLVPKRYAKAPAIKSSKPKPPREKFGEPCGCGIDLDLLDAKGELWHAWSAHERHIAKMMSLPQPMLHYTAPRSERDVLKSMAVQLLETSKDTMAKYEALDRSRIQSPLALAEVDQIYAKARADYWKALDTLDDLG